MRGVICFYSGSGNTALACKRAASLLPASFDLVDVTTSADVDFGSYDVAGLAASTDFWGVPQRMLTFIGSIPPQAGMPAFVISTFGAIGGHTLSDLAEAAAARGFAVVGGHSLRMPESYPPMIKAGMTAADSPSTKQLAAFDAFVSATGRDLEAAVAGEPVATKAVRPGWVDRLVPQRVRTTARDDMGEKLVREELCRECGTCAKGCPYGAIVLAPKPTFDMARCMGCWRCYNRCPERAIYTAKLDGRALYRGPAPALREKLGA